MRLTHSGQARTGATAWHVRGLSRRALYAQLSSRQLRRWLRGIKYSGQAARAQGRALLWHASQRRGVLHVLLSSADRGCHIHWPLVRYHSAVGLISTPACARMRTSAARTVGVPKLVLQVTELVVDRRRVLYDVLRTRGEQKQTIRLAGWVLGRAHVRVGCKVSSSPPTSTSPATSACRIVRSMILEDS